MVSGVSKSFRIIWLTLTTAIWFWITFLATHRSEQPVVLGRYSWGYSALLGGLIALATVFSLSNSRTWLSRIYAGRTTLMLLPVSLFFALGLLEAYVRVTDTLGISYYEGARRYELGKVADPELVFAHRRSWEFVYRGITYRFNEFGLRDDPIQHKNSSEYRILALGDSVAVGLGVSQSAVFTSKLQQILTAQLQRPVRVINAGVGGYNTVQEYRYLIKDGLSFEPDLVLLIYDGNDIEANEGPFDPSIISFKDKSPPQLARLVLWESWLYRLASHAYRYGWRPSRTSRFQEKEASDPGRKSSMRALVNIAAVCEKHKIPFAVFYFRWKPTPFENALLEDVRRSVAPTPVEDISKWFAGKEVRHFYNSQIDSHPNAEGHRVIAENMATDLLRQGLLPSS